MSADEKSHLMYPRGTCYTDPYDILYLRIFASSCVDFFVKLNVILPGPQALLGLCHLTAV